MLSIKDKSWSLPFPVLIRSNLGFFNRMAVSKQVIFALSEHCPQLKSIRLAGLNTQQEKLVCSALRERMPSVKPQEAAIEVEDSWESAPFETQVRH